MIEIRIIDKEGNIHVSLNINSNENIYHPSKKMTAYRELKSSKILNSMDYLIDVLEPYNDGEDFILRYVTQGFLDFTKVDNYEDVIGRRYSKIFPIYKPILEFYRNIYQNNKEEEFNIEQIEIDEDGHRKLLVSIHQKMLRENNKLFIISENQSTYEKLELDQERLFNQSPNGLLIFQNNIIVKVNESFSKMVNISADELIGSEINLNPTTYEKYSKDEIVEMNKKLMNGEIYSIEDVVKIELYKTKWFKIYGKYTLYNLMPAVQLEIKDITSEKDAENRIYELRKDLTTLETMGKVGTTHGDLSEKFIWDGGIYNILEKKMDNLSYHTDIVKNYTIPEDSERVKKIVKEARKKNSSFEVKTRIQIPNGKLKDIIAIGIHYINDEGKLTATGYIQDITTERKYQKALETSNKEKEVLLKEIHHRVKNNLQLILSFLSLDERFNKNNPEFTLESAKNRINNMALIYEQTYNSDDFININVNEFCTKQCDLLLNLYDSQNTITTINDIDENLFLTMDKLTTLSLIGNELLTNSIKYAFPKREGNEKIYLTIKEKDGDINVFYGDNGIGLPKDLDIHNSSSLGLTIINSLIEQINGEIEIVNFDGTGFKIRFPKE